MSVTGPRILVTGAPSSRRLATDSVPADSSAILLRPGHPLPKRKHRTAALELCRDERLLCCINEVPQKPDSLSQVIFRDRVRLRRPGLSRRAGPSCLEAPAA